MEFNPVSAYFWTLVACLSLGWGLAGIFRLKRDRVSRLVRMALSFSVAIASFSLLVVFLKRNTLDFFVAAKYFALGGFCAGAVLRCIPFWFRIGTLSLAVAVLVIISSAFTHTLKSDYRRVFASVISLNATTVELKVRLSPGSESVGREGPKIRPKEESFFLTGESEARNLEISTLIPSPYIFQKGSIYYIFDLAPDDSTRLMKRYPAAYDSSEWVFRLLAKAGLVEMRTFALTVPTNLLRLYLVSFDESGVPHIGFEF